MFVMMMAPNGTRILLNIEQTFAFTEDPAHLATAISLAGFGMPLGVSLDTIAADFLGGAEEGGTDADK